MRTLMLVAAVAAVALAAGTPGAAAEADVTVTFVPASDAVHVSSASPTTNFASASTLASDASGKVVLLRFPLDHTTLDPKTYEILSVRLHLHAVRVTTAGEHEARLLSSDAWSAASVTWADAPASTAAVPALRTNVVGTGGATWDVTPSWAGDAAQSLLVDWAAHDGALSLAVHPAGGSAEFSKSLWPYLEIQHRIDTSVPTPALVVVSHTEAEQADALARGWWRTPVTVEARCADARSGCLSTKARVDGAGWATGASVATVVVAGDLGGAGHKVDLCSTDRVINEGCPASGFYRYDGTAPVTGSDVVAGTAGPVATWYRSDVDVTLACVDQTGLSGCAATSWGLGAPPATPYSGAIRLSADGTHILRWSSTDAAGNVETERSRTIHIDRVPPATTADHTGLHGENGWLLSPTDLVLTCADDRLCHATRYAVDDGATVLYEAPPRFHEGVHPITFASEDAAGNLEAPATTELRIDLQPPVVAASVAGGAPWSTSPATLHLTCDDSMSGCVRQEWTLDGETWTPYDDEAPPVLPDGAYVVTHRAFDEAGRSTTSTLGVQIDTRAPTTSLALEGTQGERGWWTSPVGVTLVAEDDTSAAPDVSGVADAFARVRERGSDAEGGFLSTAALTLGEGRHDVDHHATDVADNVGEVMTSSFDVDVTPPATTVEISGTAGDDGWWLSAVGVTLSCEDATSGCASILFALDEGDEAAYEDDARPVLDREGGFMLRTRSTDHAGLTDGATTTIVSIDLTAPASVLSWQGPSGHLDVETGVRYVSSLQPLALDATDGESGVRRIEWRIAGDSTWCATSPSSAEACGEDAWTVYDGPFHVPATLPDGPFSLEHRAVDVAGNVETEVVLAFVLDNTAPLVRFERPFAPSAELDGTSLSLFMLRRAMPSDVEPLWTSVPVGNRAVVSGFVNVTANASDPLSDIESVTLDVDGARLDAAGAAHPWAWVWDARGSGLRTATLTLTATDHLGNARVATLSVLVLPDEMGGVEATREGTRLDLVAPIAIEAPLPAPVLGGDCAHVEFADGIAVRGDRAQAGRVPVQAGVLVYLCATSEEGSAEAEVDDLSQRNSGEDAWDAGRPPIEALAGEDLPDDLFGPGESSFAS